MRRRAAPAALLILGILAGCGDGEPRGRTDAPPAVPVSVVTLAPANVPIHYEFVGRTQASQRVEIRARVQGFLIKRNFEEGKRVQEKQVLFQIDPRDFQAQVEIAKARLASAQAALNRANRDVQRIEALVKTRVANERELLDAISTQEQAAAEVQLSRATLYQAELNLSYTTINAPLTGLIGRSLKDEGSLVDAVANSLLAVISQVDPMYVYFTISEREVLRWRQDVEAGRIRNIHDAQRPPVAVILADGTPYAQQGRIDFIDVAIDPNTGTATVRADIPNPQDTLRPGQSVKVRILGWERINTLAVPQQAVVQNPSGHFVYTVNDEGRAELRTVVLGPWRSDDWIVESGLNPGDRVIYEGLQKVRPGAAVAVTEAPPRPHRPPVTPAPHTAPAPAATPATPPSPPAAPAAQPATPASPTAPANK